MAKPRSEPLTPQEQRLLLALIKSEGIDATVAKTGAAKPTVMSAAVGLPIYRVTRFAIAAALALL